MTSVDSDLNSCTLSACEIPSRLKSIFKYKSLYANKLDTFLRKCGREERKIINFANY